MLFNSFRTAVALLAAATVCASCGSSTTDPAPTSTGSSAPSIATAHNAGCGVKAPGPTGVDDAFTDVPSFTVDHICPADVDPSLATTSSEFLATNAGKFLQNGSPVLSVFAGQLRSGDGDAFVNTFLSDVSSRVAPAKTVATEARDVRGYAVTHFNVPAGFEGYVYAKGPTVVIAYDLAGGAKADVAEEALATILANLFTGP